MKEIKRASKDQAERLFEIIVKATETGCTPFYPPEIMEIWHKGRSNEGMPQDQNRICKATRSRYLCS
ncbi:MAG TPA: hypothetical protein PLD55_08940 [bacterium]|nr:hypothetical protein [bacterium]HOG43744.1 hypothetical protein [bacterium]HPV21814.1 hypothetical protein [bacterium]HQM84790.1 hypothetical protein [bacterium]